MKTPDKNWLEWICFGVSALLVAGVIGYLTYDALTGGKTPPRIVFQLEAQPSDDGRHVIHVIAENHGDETAEGVHVEVLLTSGGKDERAEFVIDYLPRHGTREGFVTFMNDPARAESLRARATGYARP